MLQAAYNRSCRISAVLKHLRSEALNRAAETLEKGM
jgi:hypothetical protein